MYTVCQLDHNMLRCIDGQHKSRVEFEEKCRLRSLRLYGVKVVMDDKGIMDWSTFDVPKPK